MVGGCGDDVEWCALITGIILSVCYGLLSTTTINSPVGTTTGVSVS